MVQGSVHWIGAAEAFPLPQHYTHYIIHNYRTWGSPVQTPVATVTGLCGRQMATTPPALQHPGQTAV